ncbi:MAG: hypothetical protein IJW75_04735 [Alphaproteobacteria bacterium]|nr:hypothetical protein [Alphaproteobacteria bacterium]
MQKFIINITQPNKNLLENEELECFFLNSGLEKEFIASFVKNAKLKNKLVLSDDAATTLEYNLDGVIIDLSKSENIKKDYENLTKGLKKKFVGAICRNRRHEAMLVGECEPDFVIFRAWVDGQEKVQELTSWFSEMFLLQSALLPVEDVDFTSFETDFVILDDVKYQK